MREAFTDILVSAPWYSGASALVCMGAFRAVAGLSAVTMPHVYT